jgi:hydroxymethylpyrimidine/phosphomethylpyrimidine kinase
MNKPNVLIIAGHDPSGGAGIHADIEAVQALGGFAATLITGLTVQNSQNVFGFEMVDTQLLQRQSDALLADMHFDAVKIGMTGSPAVVALIAEVLDRLPTIPVVLDPVLAAEAGGSLSEDGDSLVAALTRDLLPRSSLITPNLEEALTLSGQAAWQEAGPELVRRGAPAALITGSADDTDDVHNHVFDADGHRSWGWPRLEGSFHGSGCTLASAVAAYLARDRALDDALAQAQRFVQSSLEQAWPVGRGQLIPDRHAR